ncbi:MAG: hypothetical protein H0X00_01725, partial [Sporichthya sp.]
MAPKNPFRRPADNQPEGPLSAEDKWFRPDSPPPVKSAGKPKPRSTAARVDDETGPQPPVAADAPTESFTPPPNWLEDKGEQSDAKAATKSAAAAAVGAGGGKAPVKGAGKPGA